MCLRTLSPEEHAIWVEQSKQAKAIRERMNAPIDPEMVAARRAAYDNAQWEILRGGRASDAENVETKMVLATMSQSDVNDVAAEWIRHA